MNKFELFTLIYFWLDHYYIESSDDKILNFLSEMNPFLWEEAGSADPALYEEFSVFINGKNITLENSLELAKEYIQSIDYVDMTEALESVDSSRWQDGCRKYLALEHKGSDVSTQ